MRNKIMKKTVALCACALSLFTVFSMSACDRGSNESLSALSAKLEGQQEVSSRQEKRIQELEKSVQELKNSNTQLVEENARLQYSVTRLEGALDYNVVAIASTHNTVWYDFEGSAVYRTQEQVLNFFSEVEAKADKPDEYEWHMKTTDGVLIDENYFDDSRFDGKALVISVFFSPYDPAIVTDHYLWKNNDVLNVEISCDYGNAAAVVEMMVIMEVDVNSVKNVAECCLMP